MQRGARGGGGRGRGRGGKSTPFMDLLCEAVTGRGGGSGRGGMNKVEACGGRGSSYRVNNNKKKGSKKASPVELAASTPRDWFIAPAAATANGNLLLGKLCLDCLVEVYGHLDAHDQSKLRSVCTHLCALFDHAFQRGYVAAAIHHDYVTELKTMHQDHEEDGHPLLRVAPVVPKLLYMRGYGSRIQKHAPNDTIATLFVNVAMVANNNALDSNFLFDAPFKAIHLFGTHTLERIRHRCMCFANFKTFTMTPLCPKLTEVGEKCIAYCDFLEHVDLSGWCAVKTVDQNFLTCSTSLERISFEGCSKLEWTGYEWLSQCPHLKHVDMSGLHSLETLSPLFLSYCDALETVNLSPCSKLNSICALVMSYCNSLALVDLSGCAELKQIDDMFLEGDPSVCNVVLPKEHTLLPNVVSRVNSICEANRLEMGK